MRVTVVNQYFPPDRSATAEVFAALVDELLKAGHEVEVVCGRPSYNTNERRSWRPVRSLGSGSTTIRQVGSSAFDRAHGWGRRLNYFSFLFVGAVASAPRAAPDVVVAGSDPPLAIRLAMLRAKGRPVVYSLQDLHPDAAIAAGMVAPGVLARWWERVHLKGLKRASCIVCIGNDMAARVQAKGIQKDKIRVIPNGTRSITGAPNLDVVADLRAGSEFVAVHAGNLGGAGAWDTLIEAARKLSGSDIDLLFVGEGAFEADLRAAGARVRPFLPESDIASVMAAGDMQIVTIKRGLEGLLVPSKIYSILAYGRPVLAVVPSESDVAEIVRTTGSGVVADPSSPEDVIDKLVWARDNPNAVEKMANSATQAAARFSRTAAMKEFVRVIESFNR